MKCKLGDYIRIKHGFAFKGEYITAENNGVVLVTPGNFEIGGGFKEDKCKFFNGDYPKEYVLSPYDLIVTMTDLSKQGDTLGYLNGLAMQKYRPTADETGIPVLKIKELRQGCCDDNSELCSPNIKSEYIIHDGDVIFSWSGSLLVDFWCGGICGLNQHLFKVTSSNYDKWFYYSWTKHHLDRFVAVAADKATTMGHIKRDELAKAEVLIPNEADYKRIRTLLQPIYDLIITNRIENKRLAKIRDILLPKLMSGELDVSAIQL